MISRAWAVVWPPLLGVVVGSLVGTAVAAWLVL